MQATILNNYSIYGKCYELKSNKTKLIVTLDLGPRIVYYGNNSVNMMFQDINNEINNSGEYFDTNFKKGECWKIYGGHRLWKSPEDMASYTPDNYPVDYTLTEGKNSVTLCIKGTKEKMTGLVKTVCITMYDCGTVELLHTFTNDSDQSVQASLWGLSVMAKNGIAVCPQNKVDTVLLSNRNLVIWPYTDIKDPRLDLGNDYITIKQDPTNTKAMKIGYLNHIGKIGYLLNDCFFVKTTELLNESYPDHDCSAELYTNNIILEIESLSPLATIEPQASYSHKEKWSFTELTGEYDINQLYKSMIE